jgi:hypothetical protein
MHPQKPGSWQRHDWTRKTGAQVLADRIVEVWRKAGHPEVSVWVEPEMLPTRSGGEDRLFVVKTNLINALPPSIVQAWQAAA